MPTLDVYVHASKRGEETTIANAGFVREDATSRAGKLLPGAYSMKVGGTLFGQLVESLHGMDPANVRIDMLEAGLDPGQRRVAYQFLVDMHLALQHAAKVRSMRSGAIGGGQIGELYESVRVVVKRDGVTLS